MPDLQNPKFGDKVQQSVTSSPVDFDALLYKFYLVYIKKNLAVNIQLNRIIWLTMNLLIYLSNVY